jgi:hypothetical protein
MSDPLSRFDPPANWDDFPHDATKRERLRSLWSSRLNELTTGVVNDRYYNPLTTRIGDARPVRVEWTCFPKETEDALTADGLSELPWEDRWRQADIRDRQAEYSEWCVTRDPVSHKIIRVTFTCEAPEYWQALWDVDPDRVLALYQELVSPRVRMGDLQSGTGYNPTNQWNTGGESLPDRGGNVHMVVTDLQNTLSAALGVIAGAVHGSGLPVGQRFHADPLINMAVARVVGRLSTRISVSNPVGLYLSDPQFNRFGLPAGAPRSAHPQDYWRVVRGRPGYILRAIYEVPARLGFTVGDIEIDGHPIRYGSQIAQTLKSGAYVTPLPVPSGS